MWCVLIVECWVSRFLKYARLRLFDVNECVASVGGVSAYPPRIVELKPCRCHHFVRLPS